MIRSPEHALDLVAKRKANGKKGLPAAVKRWCKRTGNKVPEVKNEP